MENAGDGVFVYPLDGYNYVIIATGSSGSGSGSAAQQLTPEQQWILEQQIAEDKFNATAAQSAAEARADQDTFILNNRNGNTLRVAGPGTSATVCASYENVTRNDVNVTVIVPKEDAAAEKLVETVTAENPAPEYCVGPLKVQMYVNGAPIWKDFGVFDFGVSVGKMYNGRNAKVYQILQSGEIITSTAVVVNGVVPVPMTEMGTVMVVIE